jgi:peptidoglycan/LPS O-acetylase OafA/YrhL
MESERPEYPETKRSRWKAWALAVGAFVAAEALKSAGKPDLAPYVFAILLVMAAMALISTEIDRVHRRIDSMRDGD